MKDRINLTGRLTMGAVEKKAAMAAAKSQSSVPTGKSSGKRMRRAVSEIEKTMRSIREAFRARIGEGFAVEAKRPAGVTAAYDVVSVYRSADLDDNRDPKPTVRYVFYAHTLFPNRMGSVAIYCEDPMARCARISRSGVLFGLKVAAATVEKGRSAYVDVKFTVS